MNPSTWNNCFSWRSLLKTRRPLVAGIINVTPDSFSDRGRFLAPEAAAAQALALLDAGADFLDIGGESTRPGAAEVPAPVEISRVLPVLERILSLRPATLLSIDTRHAATAEAALSIGAQIINDVSGLTFDREMATTVARFDAGVIIMHSRGTPATMNTAAMVQYDDLNGAVWEFLRRQVDLALTAGVRPEAIMLDVGIGFAKTREQNLALLEHAENWCEKCTGYPFLWGVSRKSFMDGDLKSRNRQTATWSLRLARAGAAALRVHDVAMTVAALKAGKSDDKGIAQ